MIIQGSGAHFCTGGNFGKITEDHYFQSFAFVALIQRSSNIARDIRSLPMAKVGAVHGKLIGGGVALALATSWCACPTGTMFNYGNLPRGLSPLFLFSRALP